MGLFDSLKDIVGPVVSIAGVATGQPWLTAAGGGISAFSSGLNERETLKKAKNAEDAFFEKKWAEYDMPSYEMYGKKLKADVAWLTNEIKLKAANEKKFAGFKDQNNLRAYQQQLKIRTFQHEQQKRLFQKSERLYGQSVEQAKEQAAIQMQETRMSFAFQNEDRLIESIQKKGELAASNRAGVSAAKAAQSELHDQGRQIAIMTESLISADRNTRMGLRDFLRKADAQRMLKPEAPPEPLKPLKTPLHDYQLPRAIEDFDLGVAPIKGVSFTPVPSMGSVLAGAGSAAFSAYAAQTPGTNNFKITGTEGMGGFSTVDYAGIGSADNLAQGGFEYWDTSMP